MAKGAHQKMKLLYLMKILLEETDEEHGLTLSQIIEKLKGYDVTAERKSLYDDFEALRLYGVDVVYEKKGRTWYYFIGERDFEVAELKLLVDAVQSSKFITEKKSCELIKKLESFVSVHDAKKLQRQVFVQGRIKTMNESIYYNVDKIHAAINANVVIKYHYFQWNVDKQEEFRHDGKYYHVSPWALTWDNENYYLIGYDSEAGIIKHYRVDKMRDIELTNEKREGKDLFEHFDLSEYSKSMFGMFKGDVERVGLLCDNSLAGVIIDRFGKDVDFYKKGDFQFQVNVKVSVSSQFFGWVMALGDSIQIVSPPEVVGQFREHLDKIAKKYE